MQIFPKFDFNMRLEWELYFLDFQKVIAKEALEYRRN